MQAPKPMNKGVSPSVKGEGREGGRAKARAEGYTSSAWLASVVLSVASGWWLLVVVAIGGSAKTMQEKGGKLV